MDVKKLYDHYKKSSGVSTDSRTVKEGELFFALSGANFNGNKYAEEALQKKAGLVVVDDPVYAKNDQRYLLVSSSLETLQELAKYHASTIRNSCKILGLTGSNGKTTTKELLKRVLAKKFNAWATEGNLNNHIGVPLTLLRTPDDTEFLILEMGANHSGEIKLLSEIGQPHYGLITNIGKAHLEGFGGIEGVARAKQELFNYLEKFNGVIFLNTSNSYLAKAKEFYTIKKVIYGVDKEVTAKFNADSDHTEIRIKDNEPILTRLTGEYNIENILAAYTVGNYFGIDQHDIKEAIESYIPENMRSQVVYTKSNTVLLDAYNANPTSMEHALVDFAKRASENKLLIIGEMMELGEYSKNEHEKLIHLISRVSNDVFLIGMNFKGLVFPSGFKWFLNRNDLIKYLEENIIKDKLILIKGSRSNKLETLIPYL